MNIIMSLAISALKENKAGQGIRMTGVRVFVLVWVDGGRLSRERE